MHKPRGSVKKSREAAVSKIAAILTRANQGVPRKERLRRLKALEAIARRARGRTVDDEDQP